jgi:outer membrane protein TolC
MSWRSLFTIMFASALREMSVSALTLDGALQETLKSNPVIKQAKTSVEEASGRRLILRANALPEAALSGVAGVQGVKNSDTYSNQPFGFIRGSFAQALFDAAIPASRRQGDLQVLIAEQQLNLGVIDQLHQARIAFYTALYNRSLVSFRQTQRRRLEQNISTQQARYEAGAADRSALVDAQLQARELDPQIESANAALNGALLDLTLAMGTNMGPRQSLPLPEGELQFEPTHFNLENEIAAALQRRADLKLDRLLVRAASEDQRIAKADYYPSLRAVATGEYIPVTGIRRQGADSPHRSDDFISSNIRGGAAYNWRVVDNGKVGGAVLRQQEEQEINTLTLQDMEANVPRELSRIQNNLRAIEARHDSLMKAADVAEENVRVVQQDMDQGLASQLEFRDAENSLILARTGILEAVYQQNMARAEWDRATGRYFQFSDDTKPNVH